MPGGTRDALALAAIAAGSNGKVDKRTGLRRKVKPVVERFREKYAVNPDSGCWEWQAATVSGYGVLMLNQFAGTFLAHRLSYLLRHGSIPEGLELDHLCRNRACVNPDHLEPVTTLVNQARGLGGVLRVPLTHCPRGHEYAVHGTRFPATPNYLSCKACRADLQRARRAKLRLLRDGGGT